MLSHKKRQNVVRGKISKRKTKKKSKKKETKTPRKSNNNKKTSVTTQCNATN